MVGIICTKIPFILRATLLDEYKANYLVYVSSLVVQVITTSVMTLLKFKIIYTGYQQFGLAN
jgi:hypothetical protein